MAMKSDIVSDPAISSVASDLAALCNSEAWKSWNTFKAVWLQGVPHGKGEPCKCTKLQISLACLAKLIPRYLNSV